MVQNSPILDWSLFTFSVEDPSANFQITRDFVDCIRCRKLPGFSKEKLKNGYSDDMANESREQFKINKVSS